MKPIWSVGILASALALSAIPAAAQPVISAKSGTISYVMGKVTVAGKEVQTSETKLPEVGENAVLATEDGRAETVLTLGAFLRTGDHASFKMLATRLIDTRLELLTGSHILEATDMQKDNNLTIAAKTATVVVSKRGIYRFDLDQSRIKVFEGVLGVEINGQNLLLGAGKMLDLASATPSVEKFDKETVDALDHWARLRAEQTAMANASSAKQMHDAGCDPATGSPIGSGPVITNFAAANSNGNPCAAACQPGWRYNPWFGTVTYVPCNGNIYSPYGFRYWNPENVMQAYYVPPVFHNGGNNGGAGTGYSAVPQTTTGYSGAMSTGTTSVSSAVSSGMSGTSAGGGASGGHGSAGGHGK
jgi:hypothetical protein